MSHAILKVSDLDCDFQGQIGLQTSKIFILTVKHSTASNFIFQLEMFKHLMSRTGLKTGDLDLDLQDKIGLET